MSDGWAEGGGGGDGGEGKERMGMPVQENLMADGSRCAGGNGGGGGEDEDESPGGGIRSKLSDEARAKGRAGIPNFGDEEVAYLLYLVEQHTSMGHELWPHVARRYARWARNEEMPYRNQKSLRTKFDKLVNARLTAESGPQVRKAKQLSKRISASGMTRNGVLDESNTSADEEGMDARLMSVVDGMRPSAADGSIPSFPNRNSHNGNGNKTNNNPSLSMRTTRDEDRTVGSSVDRFYNIMDTASKGLADVFRSQLNASASVSQQVMQAHQDILWLKSDVTDLKRTMDQILVEIRAIRRENDVGSIRASLDRIGEQINRPARVENDSS